MDTSFLQNMQQTHLAIWNERDRAKRDKLVDLIYADDIIMYDKDLILQGKKAISDFIDQVQLRDPDFEFTAARNMDAVQHSVRFHWKIQLRKDQPAFDGVDIFLMKEGKVRELLVFMDLPE